MSRTGIYTGVVIILIIILGAIVLALKGNNKTTPTTSTKTTTQTNSTKSTTPSSTSPSSTSTQTTSASTITYTDSGFSPATLTVKSGTKVTIKNSSSQAISFNSDPHPVHTDDPQLNVGEIAAGQSSSFTPTTTGSHGYHNHLDPTQKGTLVVN